MSIKIGVPITNYTSLLRQDDILTLNSYANSNVIQLNNEPNSTNDVFIKYKNNIATGLSSNTFVIDDVQNNARLFGANISNISLNRPVIVNDSFTIKNTLAVTSNNLTIHTGSGGAFAVYSSNINRNVFRVNANSTAELCTNKFTIQNSSASKTLLEVNPDQTSINQNVYINNGTLYVNAISGIAGNEIDIRNARYPASLIEDFLATRKISIIQGASQTDTMPFEICKKYGANNIMHIYSCNLVSGKPPTMYHNLIINKDGMVGLGTNNPDAVLSIKKISQSIISYSGETYGELFRINKQADVGIGTSSPQSQLHIRRNDDQPSETIRRNPMAYLDMSYNASNNYSNIYKDYNSTLTNDLNLYVNSVAKTSASANTFNIELTNNFYMLNADIYNIINSNITNVSNILLYNQKSLELPVPISQPGFGSTYFLMNTIINYPSSENIKIVEDSSLRVQDDAIIENNQTTYLARYVLFMMSNTTTGYINDTTSPYYNASNFTNYQTGNLTNKFNQIVYSINNYNIRIKLDFVFERNLFNEFNQTKVVSYPIKYATITKALLSPPLFMQMTYNNNFISSMTSDGTLCLGTSVPDKYKNYRLYANGPIYASYANITSFGTDKTDSNISFTNANISNVNIMTCQELNVSKLAANKIEFDTVYGTSIDMDIGKYDNLYASNLSFETMSNAYLLMNSNNVLFKNRVHFGQTVTSGNDSQCKIVVDSTKINQVKSTSNLFNHTNGLIIASDTSICNPALSVLSSSPTDTPYLCLNNSETTYYFRIQKKTNADSSVNSILQLANDNTDESRASYFFNNNTSPHIMQHIKEYNLLTLGEQNTICIDTVNKGSISVTNTNETSKISIGIPYGLIGQEYAIKDYPKYFNENLNTASNPYMLNIFGNVAIANIQNSPVFTTITDKTNGATYSAINGHPDYTNALRIFGNIGASNAMLDELLTISGNTTKSLIQYLRDLDDRVKRLEGI